MRNYNSLHYLNRYESANTDNPVSNLTNNDSSLNIIQRNYLSMNNPKFNNSIQTDPLPVYKKLSYLEAENKNKISNYMDPIAQYDTYKINKDSHKSPILQNSGTYSLKKEKIFNSNFQNSVTERSHPQENRIGHELIPNRLNLEGNNKYFRNSVFVNNNSDNDNFKHVSKISNDSPIWFQINDETKRKDTDNFYVQNNQSLHVLSKFRNWITVTPKNKNRRKPLEKEKLTSLENSKICPLWMQINPTAKIPIDQFIPIEYASLSDRVKKTILVDKNQK